MALLEIAETAEEATVGARGGGAIRVLPPALVAKIAAGEVVERPASVVKELVENALDAGATAIRVEVRRGGMTLIRVSDDGCGIAPADLELAVQRHATSKLASLDDLFCVRTLGFRGEVLASIAAVAHLEIVSRAAGASTGASIRVEGGRVVHRGPVGARQGTTVGVGQLFFNVPARHAFQRSPAGETRQIISLCNQLALTAPQVRLLLEVDGHVALQCPGSGDVREVVAAAYGPVVAHRMLALPNLEEDGVAVAGYCSGPEEHRNTRLYCTFAVNGRLVRSQMLTYAVEEAYHALLPGGRHPVAVVHLRVPPEDVDVNVHPAKTEIRLRRDRLAFSVVRNAVRQALAAFAPVPDLAPSVVTNFGSPTAPSSLSVGQTADSVLDAALGGGTSAQPSLVGAPVADVPIVGAPGPSTAAGEPVSGSSAPPRPGTSRSGLRALAQVGLTYIIAEDASGMYLIDQHSAHERVVYEQLLAQARTAEATAPSVQLLLVPEAVDLNAAQSAWLREHAQTLAQFGFTLEPFGGLSWLLRAVPCSLAVRGQHRALAELIDSLIEREYGDGPIEDQARWAIACHSAVKAGDALAPEEMAALIDQLERCDMRRTCPHGRPTMIHLSHAQLEREFGRR